MSAEYVMSLFHWSSAEKEIVKNRTFKELLFYTNRTFGNRDTLDANAANHLAVLMITALEAFSKPEN